MRPGFNLDAGSGPAAASAIREAGTAGTAIAVHHETLPRRTAPEISDQRRLVRSQGIFKIQEGQVDAAPAKKCESIGNR